MQITLNLSGEIIGQLQQLPNPEQFVSEVITRALFQRNQKVKKKRVLPVFHGDGLQPGIDLSDSRQLQERMDEDGLA
jgi:hypothetical protein